MKERLTGAIILVALIVLLVPELLTGPVHSAPRATAVASSVEEAPLRSYTIKLSDESHARGAGAHSGPEQPAPLPAVPAAGAASPPAGVASPPEPVAAEEPKSASVPPPVLPPAPPAHPPAATGATATAAQAPAAGSSGGYVVQLGSFASRANADRLARQVRAQGFPVSVSQGNTGHLYRVRVGPAHDRSAAGELAQQLRAHGHSGTIAPQ